MHLLHFMNTRAGRLTDGPYTSYDLNTLLKATAGERRAVLMGQGKPFAVLSNGAKLKWFLLGQRKLVKKRRITIST